MRTSVAFDGVLFDMDGTLINTEPLWQEAEQNMMSAYGVTWTAEDQATCHGGSAMRVTHYMADRVMTSGQPRPDPAEFEVGFEAFMLRRLTSEPVEVTDGAIRLLTEVRESGLPTALVSSSQRVLMDAVLDSLGAHWFDVTVSADDVTTHKPDPLPYLQGARAIGVDPAHCVAIEDSPTGVASATAAGTFVVALTIGAHFDPAPDRAVVSSLTDVTLSSMDAWYRAARQAESA